MNKTRAEQPSPSPSLLRRKGLLIALAIVVLALAVWAIRRGPSSTGGATRGGDGPGARPVPVTAALAVRRDVPVYLDGLGNVVALKTVTIRPQVDGRLDQVFFTEGQIVRAGQVLAQIDPRPFQNQLTQAEGAMARDSAQLKSARLDLERYRALAAKNLVPQQQADDQAGTVGQFEGAVQVDRAAIDSARLNLDYARITTPIDGVAGIRLVDPGNVVHASDTGGIVIITTLDPIAVVFTLPQDDLPAVATAMAKGSLAVEVFARDGVTLLETGRLEVVDNQINQATSTIRLKAVFPNARRTLWPNQFVTARVRLATHTAALVVPAIAVQRGPGGAFVYVIGGDSTVAPRPIVIDATQADLAVIGSGLSEGDRVVVDGQNQLRPGSKVLARDAAAAPQAAPATRPPQAKGK